MDHHITLTIDGAEYVALPAAEYMRLTGDRARESTAQNEALAYALTSLGRSLRQAREKAGLTQAELASALKKAQSTVSSAEAGRIRVSDRYVASVLKACGLPEDWTGDE